MKPPCAVAGRDIKPGMTVILAPGDDAIVVHRVEPWVAVPNWLNVYNEEGLAWCAKEDAWYAEVQITDGQADEFVRRFPTVQDYLAYHQQAGHICCGCTKQEPPLPCCNPGHEEAERLKAEFGRMIGGA